MLALFAELNPRETESLVVIAGVLGGSLLVILAVCFLGEFWGWLRPGSSNGRRRFATVLLLLAALVVTLSFLPPFAAAVRKQFDSQEAREAARPPDPPRPATSDIPFPAAARLDGPLPGEAMTVTVSMPELSLAGHCRADGPFSAELTLRADGGKPERKFRSLPVTVTDKGWEEPIRVYDAFDSPINNDWPRPTAMVQLPGGDELVGRSGTLKVLGKVSFPVTKIDKDAKGRLTAEVKSRAVSQEQPLTFITAGQRAKAAAALDEWQRERRRTGDDTAAERWEAQKVAATVAAEAAYDAGVERRVGEVCWTVRGVAAVGLAAVALLVWPTRWRRRAADATPPEG